MNSLVSEQRMDTPIELFKGRCYGDAIDRFWEQNELHSLVDEELYYLARCLMKAGKYKQSAVHLKAIESSYAGDYRFWYRLGLSQLGHGDFAEAFTAFQHAARLSTDSEIISFMQLTSAYRANLTAQSSQIFKKIAPFIREYNYFSSVPALLIKGNEGEEIKGISPESLAPEYVICSGIIQAKANGNEEAITLLEEFFWKSDQTVWGSIWTKTNVAPFKDLSSNSDAVKEKLKNFLISWDNDGRISDSSNGFYLEVLAKLCVAAGCTDVACKIFDELIALSWGDADLFMFAGECYFSCDAREKALQSFSKVIDKDPNHSLAYYKLALVYETCEQSEHAAECIKFHLNIVPRDVTALLWLGYYYLKQGDIVLAEKQAVKVMRLDPKNSELDALKALFLEIAGRPVNPKSTLADFSYIDWHRVRIPEEFRYSGGGGSEKASSRIVGIFKTLGNVVSALMVREMTTRFGKNGLGYLWVVIQQVLFIGVFAVLFKIQGRHLPYGVGHVAFLITGINAFFVMRNTKEQIRRALIRNRSLLYYRQVSPLAIYLSRGVLEMSTSIFVFTVLVGISVLAGEGLHMSSLLEVLAILFLLGLFGACFGLFIAAVAVFFPAIEHFDSALNRILFFTSGLFFYANELPEKVRDLLMLNPIFHLIELLRDGFFYSYTAKYASFEYVAYWTVGFLFCALILERVGRKKALEL